MTPPPRSAQREALTSTSLQGVVKLGYDLILEGDADGETDGVRDCGRSVREAEAESLGWRYWFDGKDMHLICPLCAHREFRSDAPASANG